MSCPRLLKPQLRGLLRGASVLTLCYATVGAVFGGYIVNLIRSEKTRRVDEFFKHMDPNELYKEMKANGCFKSLEQQP